MPDDAVTDSPTATFPNLPQTDNLMADWYAHGEAFFPIQVDIDGPKIKDTYSGMPPPLQKLVLALWYLGRDGILARCANCGNHGSIHHESPCIDYAEAYRHTCHVWICNYCGKPMNRLYAWARTRALLVATTPQIGIEIIGPQGSDVHGAAEKLAKTLGVDNIRHTVVETARSIDSRVRMVVPIPDLRYSRTQQVLRSLVGPDYSLQLIRQLPPKEVLRWMFSATEAIWTLDPDERALVFTQHKGERLIRTNGSFYAPIQAGPNAADALFTTEQLPLDATPEDLEMEEMPDEDDEAPTMCPCGCGPMRVIPKSERKIEPISEIEKRYKHVIYSNGRDLLPPRRVNRIDSKTDHTVKSVNAPATIAAQQRHGPN